MQTQIMIVTRSVPGAAAWYCRLLDAETDHDGEEFNRVMKDGEVLLMLHQWQDGEHGARLPADRATPLGDGVIIWFLTDDLEAIHRRAHELDAEIVAEPHDNPRAQWREFSLRDPDGYTVSVARM